MNTVMTLLADAATSVDGGAWDAFLRWAKIDEPWEVGLLVFGVFAQVLFFMRWIVQWVASEKRGESHMPLMFWWLSLGGATLLLIYFTLRGDLVGILGQVFGWVIYIRNLVLLRRASEPAIP